MNCQVTAKLNFLQYLLPFRGARRGGPPLTGLNVLSALLSAVESGDALAEDLGVRRHERMLSTDPLLLILGQLIIERAVVHEGAQFGNLVVE